MKKLKTKKGKKIILLNPNEKAKKYATEIACDCSFTNDYSAIKSPQLSKEQRAYRAGYLNARKDNAKAFKRNVKSVKK